MPNYLNREKSPYLLQHAENPVNWYPWCDAAFDAARNQNKPIFLSIGYSTCHWCHVMAHESFEDPEIAALLNHSFISIKVDREERPDIDAVYMSVCQAMTGAGGWPLTILMTPDQKPFFAGTYFPKHSRYGSIGLFELLLQVAALWKKEKERLIHTGNEITEWLKSASRKASDHLPSIELIRQGAEELFQSFDSTWGGFGQAPKFPTPHNLMFLLRYAILEKDSRALPIVEQTLLHMAQGGIYDHIGGGFSRYSTDEKWLIPHFEKMLYDNALLLFVYAEAYQITKNPLYHFVMKETVDYVLRELTDANGGFYCGQDADSEGVEGKYYALTIEEICTVLGEKEGTYFCSFFQMTPEGNFEGKNIPNLLNQTQWKDERIEKSCKKLLCYRQNRTALHKDDKILTSWNSLMIAAMAKASFICQEPSWLSAAQKSQVFLESHLVHSQNRLYVRYRQGEAAHPGNLEDYAYYAFALLELYQATWDTGYLKRATQIAAEMLHLFSDPDNGGFYLYANDAEQLISRPKETYDGAMPSGNSVAGLVLSVLTALTGEEQWRQERDRQMNFLADVSSHYPSGHCFALLSMCSVLYPSCELLCASAEPTLSKELLDYLQKHFLPHLTVMLLTPENKEELSSLAPYTRHYPIPQSGSQYYLCQGSTCINCSQDPIKALEQ